MTNKKRRGGFGTFLIILGILCLAGAGALAAYNWWDSERAGEAADETARILKERLNEPESEAALDEVLPEEPVYREMPVEVIDGYEYIGLLEVPSLSLSLPVMREWDYDRLKIAPCRYSGSYFTDDLVICGHNYARHFSPLRGISMGADIYFTNPEGLKIHYVAVNIQTVQPTAIEEMVENSPGDGSGLKWWDMTLFTCNLGGATRCAVRCERVRE